MTGPGPALPPPGWHPDPSARHELRYWDGSRWTEHVSDAGQVGSDDLAAPAPGATADAVAPEPGADPAPAVAATAAPAADLGAPPPSVEASPGDVLDPSGGWVAAVAAPGAPPAMMRSIGGLAASLTVVLWISVAVAAFTAFAFFNRAAVVGDMIDFDIDQGLGAALDLQQRSEDADSLVGVAFLLTVVVMLTVAVLLMIWMWRVAGNRDLVGRTDAKWRPGWTIGGWFIPFASLVIPVLVMQELWRSTDPGSPRRGGLWRQAKGSALVGWWWAAWVVMTVRFVGGGEASTDDELRRLRTTDSLAGVGSLVAIAAAVLLILVVRRITRRQEALFAGSPVVPG